MVTHWESSRRPLYVKTIWKDGQHHVILDQTKENSLETLLFRKTKQCSSNQNSHRSAKSANAGVNLKVSSVKVLLSGVNGFRNAQKSARFQEDVADKPKIWIRPSNSRPITSNNLNKEVSFNAVRGTKAPNLYKSTTIDSNCITIEKSSQLNYAPDNTLSEKVMIWLDLAIQNGQIDTEVKQDRAVTAHACHLVQKSRKNCEAKTSSVNREIISSSILKNGSPRADSVKEGMIVYSNEEVELLEEDFYHVLTPTFSEDLNIEKKTEDNKKKRVNTVKRQLHIFMPNLPKRPSDCNSSILSSKVSMK